MFAPIEPYATGMLDVGDGQAVYWETSGHPAGTPVVVLHGGPGAPTAPGMRRQFDPARYRIVLTDQRGCGHSTPSAADPRTDLSVNTTAHLVADLERLREHLGIERWLVHGGSWGTTLALAYAQAHPERVRGLLLVAVTTGSAAEGRWLYHDLSVMFPEAWSAFAAGVPESEQDDLPAAYGPLLADPDPAVRERAARRWCAWEDTVLSLEPTARPGRHDDVPAEWAVAFARICAHYVAHAAFLPAGALLRGMPRLAGIPGVLVHGRHDLSCPPRYAVEVARAWPGAELVLLDDSGHLASPRRREIVLSTVDRFADLP